MGPYVRRPWVGSAFTASLLLIELQFWTEDNKKRLNAFQSQKNKDLTQCIKIWGENVSLGSNVKRLNVFDLFWLPDGENTHYINYEK